MSREAASSSTIGVVGTFDGVRYRNLAMENSQDFRLAKPFPHAVIDQFLDHELAAAVASVFPGPDQIEWRRINNDTNQRRIQYKDSKLPLEIRGLIREMNSSRFLLFLETLTGLDGLIGDPYGLGGGAHISGRGEHLQMHEDWNWHHKLQLHRRINAILYLNESWDEAWGGGLEFWDHGTKEPARVILPAFNRLVVFSTEGSLHGHPHPNRCPANQYRRAINLYYYLSPQASVPDDPHFTRYGISASPLAKALKDDFIRGS